MNPSIESEHRRKGQNSAPEKKTHTGSMYAISDPAGLPRKGRETCQKQANGASKDPLGGRKDNSPTKEVRVSYQGELFHRV